MPVKYSIDTQHSLVYTVFSGKVTDADFDHHLQSLSSDARFEPAMPELVDLRAVTKVSLSAHTIPSSARWKLHAPRAQRAVVAPTDFLFGLARMYQSHLGEASESHFMVFRTLPPALAWLGLEAEPSLL